MITIRMLQWKLALFFAVVVMICVAPALTRAESAQWNTTLSSNYASVCCTSVSRVHLQMTLSNPGITVNYYANAFKVDASGNKIHQLSSGDTLNAGDRVLFEFSPHSNSDISWYATGSAWGTPYGYWVAGATDPGSPACVIDSTVGHGGTARYADEGNKFASGVGIIDGDDGTSGGGSNLYARYAVAPPDKSISTSGAWSGCVGTRDSNEICTVGTSGDSASATLTFATTKSNFYGDMVFWFLNARFRANSGGRNDGCLSMGALGGAITIPAQTITYNFTSQVGNNSTPTTPTVNSGGACTVGTAFTLSFTSTDPSGHQLKYGIDWDADGSIDQFVPPSGYVNSGVTQSASRTYSIGGQKTVKVLAINDQGVQSSWATDTFSCNAGSCPLGYVQQGNTCVFSACPSGYVLQGGSCVLAGSCSTPPRCSGNDLVNSCTGATIQSCAFGCASGACIVIPAPTATLSASSSLVHSGDIATVSWTSQNVTSCTVSGTNGDSWTGLSSSGKTSLPILAQTIYNLHCIGYVGANPSAIDKSVTVNIIPGFEEK